MVAFRFDDSQSTVLKATKSFKEREVREEALAAGFPSPHSSTAGSRSGWASTASDDEDDDDEEREQTELFADPARFRSSRKRSSSSDSEDGDEEVDVVIDEESIRLSEPRSQTGSAREAQSRQSSHHKSSHRKSSHHKSAHRKSAHRKASEKSGNAARSSRSRSSNSQVHRSVVSDSAAVDGSKVSLPRFNSEGPMGRSWERVQAVMARKSSSREADSRSSLTATAAFVDTSAS